MKIDYAFVSPEDGADRMGYLKTKNGKIYTMAQWYPRVEVYDDIKGWNTVPYLGPSEFYLEYGDFDVTITAPNNFMLLLPESCRILKMYILLSSLKMGRS